MTDTNGRDEGTTWGAEPDAGHVEKWSREGFAGDAAVVRRPHYGPDFTSVEGLHAPHRLALTALQPPDRTQPDALPAAIMEMRGGSRIYVSAREDAMPFCLRNVEADELHFVHAGELRYWTEFGPVDAGPGDFVCIPRSTTYQVLPLRTPTFTLIVESTGAIKLDPPGPFGMINFALDVHRPQPQLTTTSGETILVLKSWDGITRYVKPHNPLNGCAVLGGQVPVWKLNLTRIVPIAYPAGGGPPMHFAASPNRDLLFYSLSARPGGPPPVHDNADYDELIYYFRGPGAWGGVSEPGTLTWVPKGVTHHGAAEDVKAGYYAWLIETRATVRLTDIGLGVADLMETGSYGRHPRASAPHRG